MAALDLKISHGEYNDASALYFQDITTNWASNDGGHSVSDINTASLTFIVYDSSNTKILDSVLVTLFSGGGYTSQSELVFTVSPSDMGLSDQLIPDGWYEVIYTLTMDDATVYTYNFVMYVDGAIKLKIFPKIVNISKEEVVCDHLDDYKDIINPLIENAILKGSEYGASIAKKLDVLAALKHLETINP